MNRQQTDGTPEEVEGSVGAPLGFRAAGVAAGIKPSGREDVALIVSDFPAVAAGRFTQNRVVAAPVLLCKRHLAASVTHRAVVVNAGNANACTGAQGEADAAAMAKAAARLLSAAPEEILAASTGIIGRKLPMDRVESGIAAAWAGLSREGGPSAARAIMTTDTRPKSIAVRVRLPGGVATIGGICKGSGMIAPRLGTMLAFLTTDAAADRETLQACLDRTLAGTFNAVSVDGDTSTNDTVLLLANGASGVDITASRGARTGFARALEHVCNHLSRELARDGEGATKLIEVLVSGAVKTTHARQVARSIAQSCLVKTALFGNDPNWGRILCAAGYAGVALDPSRLRLRVAGIDLVRCGEPLPFDVAEASRALQSPEITIDLDLGLGRGSARFWTCDFSYDYVRINAEYTT